MASSANLCKTSNDVAHEHKGAPPSQPQTHNIIYS